MTEGQKNIAKNIELIRKIEDRVCSRIEVGVEELKTAGKVKSGLARSICIYLIYRNTKLSTYEVAEYYNRQESVARKAFYGIKESLKENDIVVADCVSVVDGELNLR